MSKNARGIKAKILFYGLAFFSLANPGSASAQGLTLTPFIGSFYAATSFVDLDVGGENLTIDQANTAVFGARLTVPIGGTLSVEGAFSYSKSEVNLRWTNSCTDGTNLFDCSTNFKGNVITGSGRLLLRPRRSNLFAIVGASYIKHSGDGWDDPSTPETSDIGGIVGFGLRAAITPRFALNLNAEGTIYSFDPDGSASTFESKTQFDLLFSVGIPITLSR